MGGGGGGPQASIRHLTNIFRRVYRIFAHAWFQHRGVFWQVEGHDGLYVFFKTVCDVYQLIPEDNYTIPHEAEGGDSDAQETPVVDQSPGMGRIDLLRRPDESGRSQLSDNAEGEATTTVSVGATTRRHKHTPSTGSHVTTIAEGPEEEEPSSNESTETNFPELSEPPRGRPLPSSEDTIEGGFEKLSLGDLDAEANAYGPHGQPTPQPQDVERDPMEQLGKNKASPSEIAKEAGDTSGTDIGREEDDDKKKETQQTASEDEDFEDSRSEHKTSVETPSLPEGKADEEKLEDDGSRRGVNDEKEEQTEGNTVGSEDP